MMVDTINDNRKTFIRNSVIPSKKKRKAPTNYKNKILVLTYSLKIVYEKRR